MRLLYVEFFANYSEKLLQFLIICGDVAQWLAPQICSANREVGSSNLTVSTDDPLG